MVKEVMMYEDGAGNVHRSQLEAHRADLQQWLQGTGLVNEASAATLAAHIVGDRKTLDTFIEMLQPIVDLAPSAECAA